MSCGNATFGGGVIVNGEATGLGVGGTIVVIVGLNDFDGTGAAETVGGGGGAPLLAALACFKASPSNILLVMVF